MTCYLLNGTTCLAPDHPPLHSELTKEQIKELCADLFNAGDMRRSRTALWLAIPVEDWLNVEISLGYEETSGGTLHGFVSADGTSVFTKEYTSSVEAWPDLWKTFRRMVKAQVAYATESRDRVFRKQKLLEKIEDLDPDSHIIETCLSLFEWEK